MAGSDKLGVVGKQSRGKNHHFGVTDIFGFLPENNGNTELAYTVQSVRFIIVGPRKLISLGMEYLGKRAHACAADSYKMNAFDSVKKFIYFVH